MIYILYILIAFAIVYLFSTSKIHQPDSSRSLKIQWIEAIKDVNMQLSFLLLFVLYTLEFLSI